MRSRHKRSKIEKQDLIELEIMKFAVKKKSDTKAIGGGGNDRLRV
jgi:hypothetical protein